MLPICARLMSGIRQWPRRGRQQGTPTQSPVIRRGAVISKDKEMHEKVKWATPSTARFSDSLLVHVLLWSNHAKFRCCFHGCALSGAERPRQHHQPLCCIHHSPDQPHGCLLGSAEIFRDLGFERFLKASFGSSALEVIGGSSILQRWGARSGP